MKKIVDLNETECELIENIAVEGERKNEIDSDRYHLSFESQAFEATHADTEDNYNKAKEADHENLYNWLDIPLFLHVRGILSLFILSFECLSLKRVAIITTEYHYSKEPISILNLRIFLKQICLSKFFTDGIFFETQEASKIWNIIGLL